MPKIWVPKEPKQVKEWMRKNEEHFGSLPIPKRKRDALVIWYGNKLPQYLWNNWKNQLRVEGLTWQKFLRLMKFSEEKIILWYQNKLSWKELVKKITNLIKKLD
jgi:hypothetical protein